MDRIQLLSDILQMIDNENAPTGASYLSVKLNIPVATVGRILRKLESQGYLKKVSNKGRILTPAGKQHMVDLHNRIHTVKNAEGLFQLSTSTDRQSMLNVLYVRRALEGEIARQACRKITPEGVMELKRIVSKRDSEYAAKRIVEEHDYQDYFSFHQALAHITGNPCFEQVLTLILSEEDVFYANLSVIWKYAEDMPHYVSHDQIIHALEIHDEELAHRLLLQHIDFYIHYIDQYYDNESD